jgi:uncharacterized membrane protein YraQ (UPF0718 family)
MLSAPVVNPVVLASTYFAFNGDLTMVAGRLFIAAGIAGIMALIANRMGNILLVGHNGANEAHGVGHGDHIHDATTVPHSENIMTKATEVLRHGAHEFIDMGKFLILGAVAAGVFKTFLPQSILSAFSANPALEIIGMMVLAVLLSVCSEADAFVAASFQSFSAASQLAFVTIGPMIDLKLIGMYAVTFQRRFFVVLMLGPTLLVFIVSLLFGIIR